MQAVFDSMSAKNHAPKCTGYCGCLDTTLNPKGKRRCAPFVKAYAKAMDEASAMGATFKVKDYRGRLVTVKKARRA